VSSFLPARPPIPIPLPSSEGRSDRLVHLLRAATWRVLNPSERSRYIEAGPPRPLSRLYYEASDGWRAPLFHLPAAAGGSGEPVVLAHALGLSSDSFRYGAGPTLASSLSRAGFHVYLLSHRGDRAALAPRPGCGFDFDDIVRHDVPAALARVHDHAGYSRVHWIGHGLGGQLGLAWAGTTSADGLASVVCIGAPMRFSPSRSELRRRRRVASMLPRHWSVPSRSLAWAAAPFVHASVDLGGRATSIAPARLRGLMHHAVEDVPLGIIRQLEAWIEHGSCCDRSGLLDYTEALRDAKVPLLVVVSHDSPGLNDGSATLDHWGGADRSALVLPESFAQLDAVLGAAADEQVFEPVVKWLTARRRLSWERQPRT
jgi:predicted alpha/beta hydrolase